MKKYKIVSILMIVCLMLGMSACGEKDEGGKYTSKELLAKVTDDITNLPQMTTVDSDSENAKDIFTYLSDIDYESIEDYAFTYSKDGLADEVSVIQLKDEADVSSVEKDLNDRINTRRSTFSTYNEEELKKFDTATVVSKDCYVMIIITSQAVNGKYAFNEAFK